jgi:predicted alpha/beta hydrolase family esterase
VNKDFNWNKIKNNSEYIYMCHGNNDPYVPLENAQILADNLNIDIDYIENG